MDGRMMATWRPMNRLRAEIDQLFEDFFGAGDAFTPFAGAQTRPTRARAFPALNMWEDDGTLYVEAELPGMTMDDLELLVRGNELTIKGERAGFEQEGVTYHRRERGFGAFSRVVRLPVEIDADNVEATFEHGVLGITLPKAASARPRKIEVKALSK